MRHMHKKCKSLEGIRAHGPESLLHCIRNSNSSSSWNKRKKKSKYVKNVISLVSEKKNIHTHFGMQIDNAQSHGNHVHKRVNNKWILKIIRSAHL